MEALMKLAESFDLTEEQKDNLEDLIEDLTPQPGFEMASMPALLNTRLGLHSMRLRANTSTDELAPESVQPGDIYIPGKILARLKEKESFLCTPLMGKRGNLRWLPGDRMPDCFSNDGVTSGVTGEKCADCPDLPWRDRERQDCDNVWHWVLLAADFSGIYYVTFRSTSFKTGSALATLTKGKPGAKMVKIYAEKTMNAAKQPYFIWKQSTLEETVPTPLKKLARQLGGLIADKHFDIVSEDQKMIRPITIAEGTGATVDVDAVTDGNDSKEVTDM